MNTQWQQFLLEQGGALNGEGQLDFANLNDAIHALDKNGVICSLDYLGCIRASGTDAQSFLQAQLSNDINILQGSRTQLSAYCNPKGRMLAQFLVLPDKQDYLLLLPRSILEPTLKRLRMFILRSLVTLTDVSDDVVCLGLAGKDIEQSLASSASMPSLPTEEYQISESNEIRLSKLPGTCPRYLCICEQPKAKELWQQTSTQLLPSDQHIWHWLDIQAGLPSLWPQTVEEFVPQMLNLELIDGVNFKKGCYPGQEIVARMHYLGKPKRRMYHLTLKADQAPAPGTDVYETNGDGQSAGKIVLAETGPSETHVLAVVKTDKAKTTLGLGAPDGPTMTMDVLPYTVQAD